MEAGMILSKVLRSVAARLAMKLGSLSSYCRESYGKVLSISCCVWL